MLALAVVVGIVFGYLGRGRLRGIEKRLRWYALPIVAMLIEILIQIIYPGFADTIPLIVPFLIEYALLFIFLGANFRQFWLSIPVGLGALCNFLVMLFAGGAMPVSPDVFQFPEFATQAQNLKDGLIPGYVLMAADQPLWFLGDIFYTPPPVFGFASLGDILIALGVCVFLMTAMWANRPQGRHHQADNTARRTQAPVSRQSAPTPRNPAASRTTPRRPDPRPAPRSPSRPGELSLYPSESGDRPSRRTQPVLRQEAYDAQQPIESEAALLDQEDEGVDLLAASMVDAIIRERRDAAARDDLDQ